MDRNPTQHDCSIILGTTAYLNLTVPLSYEQLTASIWQSHHHGDYYRPLTDSSIILGITTHLNRIVPSPCGKIPTSIWQSHNPEDNDPPQLDSSIILGETLPTSTWRFHHPGVHYLLISDCSIIFVTTAYLKLKVPSCWGLLPTSTWHFRHPEGHCLPQLDSFIIRGTTTYLYLTVPSSWGTLLTCTWLVDYPGDHTPPLHVSSIIMEPLSRLPDSSIILRTPPTSTWQFHHIVDHYLPLPDRSIIKGTTTHLFLTVRSLCGPLSTSLRITTHLYIYTWQFHHLGDNYPPLPDCFVIIGATTHHYPTVPSSWGQLPISA